MFHYGQDIGYAIKKLVPVFISMAERLVGDKDSIHISFTSLSGDGQGERLYGCNNLLAFDPATRDTRDHAFIEEYVRSHGIDVVFGFDQPVWRPWYKAVRRGGVRRIISYQGAPMSSLNRGIKLWLKRAEILFTAGSPDHFIFESIAMAETAYRGRGISRKKTSVVYTGVDPVRFSPANGCSSYVHDTFNIPRDRKIIYYSGHMEERKGVAVLIHAAKHLYDSEARRNFHFLILGNQAGQEQRYLDMLGGGGAKDHVTFGGYRDDVEQILPSCYAGAIASTGWDSFPMSSLEIAACGLPLIISRLQGCVETVTHGETGFLFNTGDYKELACRIIELLDNTALRNRLGENARQRILSRFTLQQQVENLVGVMTSVSSG